MGIVTDTITAPSYWASYLVNGDDSSLTTSEKLQADRWRQGKNVEQVLDCIEGSERYTNHYKLYAPDTNASAGRVADYIVTLKPEKEQSQ
jgi:hypothetical protein